MKDTNLLKTQTNNTSLLLYSTIWQFLVYPVSLVKGHVHVITEEHRGFILQTHNSERLLYGTDNHLATSSLPAKCIPVMSR